MNREIIEEALSEHKLGFTAFDVTESCYGYVVDFVGADRARRQDYDTALSAALGVDGIMEVLVLRFYKRMPVRMRFAKRSDSKTNVSERSGSRRQL
jgi:hypothetical protein